MQAVKDGCASMLESLFSACSNPLCIADKNGIILMANEAMHNYAGALSGALVSKNLFELDQMRILGKAVAFLSAI